MELEDCAFKSLASINLFNQNNISDNQASLQQKISSSKYLFVFENYQFFETFTYSAETLIIIHLINESEVSDNLNINEFQFFDSQSDSSSQQQHLKTFSTLPFTYENVIKSILAKNLSGTHAGSEKLDVRSVQIENVSVYGRLSHRNKWQVDLKNCQIKNLENSAITLMSENPPSSSSQNFTRKLQDILIDKEFIKTKLQELTDNRILNTPINKRLVSESKSLIYGLHNILNQVETHYISINADENNNMSLPHSLVENSENDEQENSASFVLACSGLAGITNSEVREDILNMNFPSENGIILTDSEKVEVVEIDAKNEDVE